MEVGQRIESIAGEVLAPEERRQLLAELLVLVFDADRIIIGRVEKDIIRAVSGVAMGVAGDPRYATLPITRGVIGRCARERKPLRIDDVRRHPDYIAATALTRSELAVPVLVDGAAVAVINIESNRFAAFSAETERGLVAAAAGVAARRSEYGL